MRRSYIIFRDGHQTHQLDIAHRDWGLLTGPFFDEGQRFIDALGVYQHFTVADGIPDGSQVIRQRFLLTEVTPALYRAVERDADLLSYDYSYSVTVRSSRRHSSRSFAPGA